MFSKRKNEFDRIWEYFYQNQDLFIVNSENMNKLMTQSRVKSEEECQENIRKLHILSFLEQTRFLNGKIGYEITNTGKDMYRCLVL